MAGSRSLRSLPGHGEVLMRSAVILFPASNRDRDAIETLEKVTGKTPYKVWHGEGAVPDDAGLIVIPGGFSYGDYLRCGAMAAQSRIMRDVKAKAAKGVAVLGICNGFQVLTESGLLPGALMRNADLKFVSRDVPVVVEETQSAFTRRYHKGERVIYPVAHGEGNYYADAETIARLEGEGRVLFRYAPGENPNGSVNDIAGILNDRRN